MILPVADRLSEIDEYYFSKKLEEVAKLNQAGHDVINLGIGSPDFSPPKQVLEVTKQVLSLENVHGYAPYRSGKLLREEYGIWFTKQYGVKVNPEDEVLPLIGSKEGVLFLSMAMLNPGDVVLIPNPGYPAYASVAKLIGAKICYYNLIEENGWLPDLSELESLDLSRCKLMWINYPHMPTGASANGKVFQTLIEFAKKNKILLCNDSPYAQILNEVEPMSLLTFDPKMEVSCELNSMSKAFNMAGWRVGFFVGSKKLVDAVNAIRGQTNSGIFMPIQAGSIAALKLDETWFVQQNTKYKQRRNLVWKFFNLLGFTYDRNATGLFVWAKAPERIDRVEEFLDKILHHSHVFLTPGSIFGSNGERYARASLCATEERIQLAIKRIENLDYE